ncbi:hypothetical protein BOTCAL_0276g00130 [Botryotinia calthae]|uniref:Uncharacterized protein n=1 Tax=Botryotinia calthae TaxID=38488 RepID=A0A4Y8CVH8_9HELO|nr:hypothetical protein BOTCAL_0276g00130 [Botryotinia calthae]
MGFDFNLMLQRGRNVSIIRGKSRKAEKGGRKDEKNKKNEAYLASCCDVVATTPGTYTNLQSAQALNTASLLLRELSREGFMKKQTSYSKDPAHFIYSSPLTTPSSVKAR